jgi:hypothetical protein
MNDVDYSGAGAIRELIGEARQRGVKVVACEVEPGVVRRQNQYGLQAEVDGVYDSVHDVIAAFDRRAVPEVPVAPDVPSTTPQPSTS